MNAIDSMFAREFTRALRQQFINRLRERGIISGPELIRVHRIAQELRIAPEDAVVILGLMSADEVLDLLTEGATGVAPVEFARAG